MQILCNLKYILKQKTNLRDRALKALRLCWFSDKAKIYYCLRQFRNHFFFFLRQHRIQYFPYFKLNSKRFGNEIRNTVSKSAVTWYLWYKQKSVTHCYLLYIKTSTPSPSQKRYKTSSHLYTVTPSTSIWRTSQNSIKLITNEGIEIKKIKNHTVFHTCSHTHLEQMKKY